MTLRAVIVPICFRVCCAHGKGDRGNEMVVIIRIVFIVGSFLSMSNNYSEVVCTANFGGVKLQFFVLAAW